MFPGVVAAAAVVVQLFVAATAAQTSVANGAQISGVSPTLTADLDGNGASETVTAIPSRGAVRIEIRDASGKKVADGKASAPAGDVVPVTLTSGPLGSSGALVEVVAATDAMECRAIFRYRDGRLTPLPIRDASGRALPDCAAPAGWTSSWAREGDGRPAAWVRERTQKVDAGSLRTREAYGFAGFSLDFDPSRSSADIAGIPIPSWYSATLYSRAALETLYSRFDLDAMRREPALRIDADRTGGVFALRFAGPAGTLVAPVESYAASGDTATLGARSGEKTARVEMRMGGDGSIPYEVRVNGLGADWDRVYAPAGAWRGGARQVFPSAADELATNDLAGLWGDKAGRSTSFAIEGHPPFRLRIGKAIYTIDLEDAAPPFDVLLLPASAEGKPWGVVLRGSNGLERVPLVCDAGAGQSPRPPCRPDGEAETLRRLGARVNVR